MKNMRAFWVVFVVFGSANAWAAPQKPIGDAKEDMVVAPPSPGGSERALHQGILWAFEPWPIDVRIQAIEDLGFLGDPRALNVLAQFCLDPNPMIARAGVRAVAAIRHPRAEEILVNLLRHPSVQDTIKLRALELLPFQNTWSSIRFIRLIATQTSMVNSVVVQARRMSAELPPPPSFSEPKPQTPGSGPEGAWAPMPFTPGESK